MLPSRNKRTTQNKTGTKTPNKTSKSKQILSPLDDTPIVVNNKIRTPSPDRKSSGTFNSAENSRLVPLSEARPSSPTIIRAETPKNQVMKKTFVPEKYSPFVQNRRDSLPNSIIPPTPSRDNIGIVSNSYNISTPISSGNNAVSSIPTPILSRNNAMSSIPTPKSGSVSNMASTPSTSVMASIPSATANISSTSVMASTPSLTVTNSPKRNIGTPTRSVTIPPESPIDKTRVISMERTPVVGTRAESERNTSSPVLTSKSPLAPVSSTLSVSPIATPAARTSNNQVISSSPTVFKTTNNFPESPTNLTVTPLPRTSSNFPDSPTNNVNLVPNPVATPITRTDDTSVIRANSPIATRSSNVASLTPISSASLPNPEVPLNKSDILTLKTPTGVRQTISSIPIAKQSPLVNVPTRKQSPIRQLIPSPIILVTPKRAVTSQKTEGGKIKEVLSKEFERKSTYEEIDNSVQKSKPDSLGQKNSSNSGQKNKPNSPASKNSSKVGEKTSFKELDSPGQKNNSKIGEKNKLDSLGQKNTYKEIGTSEEKISPKKSEKVDFTKTTDNIVTREPTPPIRTREPLPSLRKEPTPVRKEPNLKEECNSVNKEAEEIRIKEREKIEKENREREREEKERENRARERERIEEIRIKEREKLEKENREREREEKEREIRIKEREKIEKENRARERERIEREEKERENRARERAERERAERERAEIRIKEERENRARECERIEKENRAKEREEEIRIKEERENRARERERIEKEEIRIKESRVREEKERENRIKEREKLERLEKESREKLERLEKESREKEAKLERLEKLEKEQREKEARLEKLEREEREREKQEIEREERDRIRYQEQKCRNQRELEERTKTRDEERTKTRDEERARTRDEERTRTRDEERTRSKFRAEDEDGAKNDERTNFRDEDEERNRFKSRDEDDEERIRDKDRTGFREKEERAKLREQERIREQMGQRARERGRERNYNKIEDSSRRDYDYSEREKNNYSSEEKNPTNRRNYTDNIERYLSSDRDREERYSTSTGDKDEERYSTSGRDREGRYSTSNRDKDEQERCLSARGEGRCLSTRGEGRCLSTRGEGRCSTFNRNGDEERSSTFNRNGDEERCSTSNRNGDEERCSNVKERRYTPPKQLDRSRDSDRNRNSTPSPTRKTYKSKKEEETISPPTGLSSPLIKQSSPILIEKNEPKVAASPLVVPTLVKAVPTAQPTVAGNVEADGQTRPDYRNMDIEERQRYMNEFTVKLTLLRRSYREFAFEDYPPNLDLDSIHNIYASYVKQVVVSQSCKQWKIYLALMFLGLEAFGTKVLNLDMKGFTLSQWKSIERYETLLTEIGERQYVVGTSSWSPEVRLAFMGFSSAVTFILVKYLSNFIGGEAAIAPIQAMIESLLSGTSAPSILPVGGAIPTAGATTTTETIPPAGATTPPAPAGGGFDLMGMLGNLLGGNTGAGGGGIADIIANLAPKLMGSIGNKPTPAVTANATPINSVPRRRPKFKAPSISSSASTSTEEQS